MTRKPYNKPSLSPMEIAERAGVGGERCPLVDNEDRCELLAGHEGAHVIVKKEGLLVIGNGTTEEKS